MTTVVYNRKIPRLFPRSQKHQEEIDGLQESKALTRKLEYYVKDLENELRKA